MQRGEIQLIIGPMFSGKSTELLRRIKRYKVANKRCIVFKHELDNERLRVELKSSISTHDDETHDAIPTISLTEEANNYNNFINYDVIGIDEGQFFDDLALISDKLANLGKIVIIAALDATYERKEFENVSILIPLCERVTKLTAVCKDCCYDSAPFSYRLTKDKSTILIGKDEHYISLCRLCYNKRSEKIFPLDSNWLYGVNPSTPIRVAALIRLYSKLPWRSELIDAVNGHCEGTRNAINLLLYRDRSIKQENTIMEYVCQPWDLNISIDLPSLRIEYPELPWLDM